MAAASKEAPKDEVFTGGSQILSLVYRFFKKVSIVGAVYLVGYMRWSVAWLICPVILSVLREQWRKESDYKRMLAKTAATSSEKEVVLARLQDLPAWVFFPDVERAEWLNRILSQVWPNVNHYARTLLKETIGPNIAESLANFKLNGFKFERMILGTIAPRVGGVKVYDKNLSRNEIIMDIDLFYAGDCDISFVLSGIRGGIKDLQIHGPLRVVMKPLITTIPLVGGVQVFFLNNPSIDFNLVGAADVLDMPGFSDILRRCIIEQIGKIMVLPNKLPIKLSDEIPSHDLRMPEPEGMLRIHVVEAKNLMKKDIGMLGKGKSDPYALITVGAQKFKTKTIDNDVNPKWHFWCESQIMSRKVQMLEMEVWDYDPGFPGAQNDDFLGRCSLDIANVVKAGKMDIWQNLQEAKHGMVHLRLYWFELTKNVNDLNAALMETELIQFTYLSTAILSIYIDSCKNLPNARAQSKPDPYLIITVGKKTENSSVLMRTGDPVYEIGYSFLVNNPHNDGIDIKIQDQKTGNQLGQLTYGLATLLKQPDLSITTQPLMLQKSGPESKIIMSMCLRIVKEPSTEVIRTSDDVTDAVPSESTVTTNNHHNNESPSPKRQANMNDNPESEQDMIDKVIEELTSTPAHSSESKPSLPSTPKLVHRASTLTNSAGEAGLGRIQLSVRYSVQRQELVVVVHKIANIPLKDPSNIPDPYVKLYLLPGRAKESKRKTAVIKDNCNPVFDERFEYSIPGSELIKKSLEVTVATHKGFLGGSPIIGQVIINFADYDLTQAQTLWYDLLPEVHSNPYNSLK